VGGYFVYVCQNNKKNRTLVRSDELLVVILYGDVFARETMANECLNKSCGGVAVADLAEQHVSRKRKHECCASLPSAKSLKEPSQ